MLKANIAQLASVIGSPSEIDSSTAQMEFAGVVTDSRQITPGCCFFAIKGENFDGHNFVNDALSNGAICAVVSEPVDNPTGQVLVVNDTIVALGNLARWYRNTLRGKVIGITGSAGKTTTRQMTHHVLSQYHKCHQSPKSFNNNIGLPLTLLSADSEDEFIIVELGTNALGEIEYLTNIAEPDVAVVLNALEVHLEGLGSVEKIIEEKTAIAKSIKSGGSLLINTDTAIINYCKQQGHEFMTFGTEVNSNIVADSISLGPSSSKFTIDDVNVEVPLPSSAAVQNAIAAWAICKTVGLTASEFARAIKTFKPVSMRMQVSKLVSPDKGSVTIINDCYNANPSSMANAIEYLAMLKKGSNSRTVLICGTMGELGAESPGLHAKVGRFASDFGIDLILAAGAYTDSLLEAAEKDNSKIRTQFFESTDQLCNNLHEFIKPDDIILVKGSRSARLEQAVSVLETLFS